VDGFSLASSFISFFFKYCTSVEDVILNLHIGEENKDFLDLFFQILSLRRVVLVLNVRAATLDIKLPPLCKDLKLLNIQTHDHPLYYDLLLKVRLGSRIVDLVNFAFCRDCLTLKNSTWVCFMTTKTYLHR
jgi:hypothetical protein